MLHPEVETVTYESLLDGVPVNDIVFVLVTQDHPRGTSRHTFFRYNITDLPRWHEGERDESVRMVLLDVAHLPVHKEFHNLIVEIPWDGVNGRVPEIVQDLSCLSVARRELEAAFTDDEVRVLLDDMMGKRG